MTPEDIKELAQEILGNSEEIKSLITTSILAVDEFLPQITPQVERLQNYAVDSCARMVKRFVTEHGFTTDDAIKLCIGLTSAVSNKGNSKK